MKLVLALVMVCGVSTANTVDPDTVCLKKAKKECFVQQKKIGLGCDSLIPFLKCLRVCSLEAQQKCFPAESSEQSR